MIDPQVLSLLEQFAGGEMAAVVPLADALMDVDHPRADRLCELALVIRDNESWYEVFSAIVEIETILKSTGVTGDEQGSP